MDEQAKRFLDTFLPQRAINKEYYRLVPEDQYNFRMVDTPQKKSDSPRDSIVHQIYVTKKYIYGVKTGKLAFDGIVEHKLQNPEKMSKNELLKELENTEKELIDVLQDTKIGNKKVTVPWSSSPISAVSSLWGLSSHEILHTGWNLAIMDHLGIERFPLLKQMWG